MTALRVAAHLVGVNVLILAGTLLGGVLLGAFPALAAGGAVLGGIRSGSPSERLWHDFWSAYRASWRRMNLLGAPFWALAVMLAADALILSGARDGAPVALWAGLAAIAAYGAVSLAFLLPSARRGEGAARTWRFVALAPALSPATSAAVLVTLCALAVVAAWATVLLPLMGVSLPLLLTGWLVEHRPDALEAARAAPEPETPATSGAAPTPAVDSRTTIE
ncbi:DUF624 domain-containing protein [Cellulomonas timonensis]|uniref:DUF624 domain-containing protein n=1 Tax=Cellulomonas timonensis TaxID=1689271 RepID=UPI0036F1F889